MLGEPDNQFSLTRAALSTRGAQKQILINNADSFGNFVAGFAAENAGGYVGLWGAYIGGTLFAPRPENPSLHSLISRDADSRPDINAGYAFAGQMNNAIASFSQQGFSGFQYSVNTISMTASPPQILHFMPLSSSR